MPTYTNSHTLVHVMSTPSKTAVTTHILDGTMVYLGRNICVVYKKK